MVRVAPRYLIGPIVLVLLAGCGKTEDDRLPVYPVRGMVKYRGVAVGGATVVFSRQGQGRGAAGTTNADGRFNLRTYEPEDGAIAGEYVVVIQKAMADNDWGRKINEMNFQSTQEYEDWKLANKVPADLDSRGTRSLVPRRYGDPSSSPLRATVVAGGPNEFTFGLTD